MWLGVLMADWCILAPCLLLFALMCAPFVGGSWDGDRFHAMAYPAIAVVVLSSILVPCGFSPCPLVLLDCDWIGDGDCMDKYP